MARRRTAGARKNRRILGGGLLLALAATSPGAAVDVQIRRGDQAPSGQTLVAAFIRLWRGARASSASASERCVEGHRGCQSLVSLGERQRATVPPSDPRPSIGVLARDLEVADLISKAHRDLGPSPIYGP